MAVGVILNGLGVSKEQYEQISSMVSPDQTAPAGMRYHLAGSTPDGLCIVEVWESQDALYAFFGSQVQPVLESLGIDFQPTFFEVINEIKG